MILGYSRNFWLICFSLLFFITSFNLFLPELNEYITNMGGENRKGLIFFLFSISAAISRPFSGKLSDTIGRKKVMYIGIIISIVATLFYPITEVVFYFLLLRFLHGFGAGFLPTGATALVTDILPEHKRGKGMGIWGVFISLGFGVGQIFASPIRTELGLTNLFFIAAILGVFSAILISFVKETLPNPQKFKLSLLKVKWNDVFEPSVMPAAIVMFLSVTSSGIIFVVTQDLPGYFGLDNKGWFFGFYTLSTIFVRFFSGGLSDSIGRRKTLLIGMCIMLLSISLLAFSTEWIQFTISAIVFGIATGITSPTLFAWTADLSHIDRRGVGAGTLFIALELGIMFGSASTMLTYDNTIATIPIVFSVGITLMLINISYLIWHLKYRESKT
ncbi:MAG TPA: MFS transporter [Crocinitomicaceae bacterium]|nr:MFS transporter [Crocinitomicaceae bacterium]